MKFFGIELEERPPYLVARLGDAHVIVQGFLGRRLASLQIGTLGISGEGETNDLAVRDLEAKVRVLKTKLEGITKP